MFRLVPLCVIVSHLLCEVNRNEYHWQRLRLKLLPRHEHRKRERARDYFIKFTTWVHSPLLLSNRLSFQSHVSASGRVSVSYTEKLQTVLKIAKWLPHLTQHILFYVLKTSRVPFNRWIWSFSAVPPIPLLQLAWLSLTLDSRWRVIRV